MERAIELAIKAEGWTNPNPLVGAVIVKDGEVIAEGYHKKYGELHAERDALASLENPAAAEGATMYVTLEPCCHYGLQPPCTDAIIESKLARVVVGSRDPNPKVAGKGVQILRDAGIEVVEDYMRDECDAINDVFMHYMNTGKPYVVMKYAMTADGKIATKTSESQWVTGPESREQVHRQRHKYMAIMVGIGTVLADDPMLNTRIDGLKSPIRIICDSKLRISLESRIVKTAGEYQTIVACVNHADEEKKLELESLGIQVIECASEDGRIDLDLLMTKLGKLKIDSILLEGGGTLNHSALEAWIVNEVELYIGPRIWGGQNAKTPVEGLGVARTSDGAELELVELECIESDIHARYMVRKGLRCSQE